MIVINQNPLSRLNRAAFFYVFIECDTSFLYNKVDETGVV
jgi:hypothetical protein